MPKWRAIRNDHGRIMVAICANMHLGDAWEHEDDPRYPEKFSGLSFSHCAQLHYLFDDPLRDDTLSLSTDSPRAFGSMFEFFFKYPTSVYSARPVCAFSEHGRIGYLCFSSSRLPTGTRG